MPTNYLLSRTQALRATPLQPLKRFHHQFREEMIKGDLWGS